MSESNTPAPTTPKVADATNPAGPFAIVNQQSNTITITSLEGSTEWTKENAMQLAQEIMQASRQIPSSQPPVVDQAPAETTTPPTENPNEPSPQIEP